MDENYVIVQKCYPYLAWHLFTDKSLCAKAALRAMLGLSNKAEGMTVLASSGLVAVKAGVYGNTAEKSALSPKKLLEMTDNFASYTAATATVDHDRLGKIAAVKEFAKLLLDKDGSTEYISIKNDGEISPSSACSVKPRPLPHSRLKKLKKSDFFGRLPGFRCRAR